MQEDDSEQESPEPLQQQRPGGIAAYRVIFTFTRPSHYLILLSAGLFASLSGLIKPAISVLTGRFLSSFTNYAAGIISDDKVKQDTSSTIYALIVVGVISLLTRAGFCASWIAYGELQAKAVREDLFSALLIRHLGWFEAQEAGVSTLLSRIQTQILDFQSGTSQPLGTVIVILVQSVASLAVAFYYSWKLTLVVLGSFPLLAGGLSWLSTGYRQALDGQQAELTLATKQLLHSIQNIVLLKCHNTQNDEVERYMRSIESADNHFRRQTRISVSETAFLRAATAIILVISLGFGTYLVHEDHAKSGDIMTTFWSASQGAIGVNAILTQLLVLEKGRAAAAALRLLLLEVEQGALLLEDYKGRAPFRLDGDIEFIDVGFSYPSQPTHKVLNDVKFFFPAHETTFVVGKSGSGKSSLAALLLRFYTADSGCIELDGIDIKTLDTWWLRNNITLVQQSSVLFSGSIRDNISICCDEQAQPTHLDLTQCLEFAVLQEVVEALPNGIETDIGKGGGNISGGQRQRMALARARLRDTPILLLDESTSALDHTSTVKIMNNIREWRQGKTTIIITHDMSQIQSGDFMYVLKDGEVISEGFRHDVVQHLQQSGNEDMIGRPPTPVNSDSQLPNRRKTRIEPLLRPELSRSQSYSSIELPGAESTGTTVSSMAETSLLIDRIKRRTGIAAGMNGKWTNRTRKRQGATAFTGYVDGRIPILSERIDNKGKIELIHLGSSTYQRKALPAVIQNVDKTDLDDLKLPRKLHDRMTMTSLASRYSLHPTLTLRPTYEQQNLSLPIPVQPITIWADNHTDIGKDDSNMSSDEHQASSQPPSPSFRRIIYTIWPALGIRQKRVLLIALCAAASYGAIPALSSWLMSHLFQNFQQQDAWQSAAVKWSVLFVVVGFVDGGLFFGAQFMLETTGQSWVRALRQQAVGLILRQPKSWFDGADLSLSEICATLDKAAEDVRDLLSKFTAAILIATVTVLVAIIWGMVICWKLLLVSLASAPVIYIITKTMDTVSHRWQVRSVDAATNVAEVFSESFSDIRTVRALTLESRFHQKFTASTSNAFQIGLQRGFYLGLSFGASDSIAPLMTAAVFGYSIKLATTHESSTSSIITALVMIIFCLTSASAILSNVPQIASSLEAGGRLLKLKDLPSNSHEQDGHLEMTEQDFVGGVAFHRFSFAYPTRPNAYVLKNLQLTIPGGRLTVLVGKSGCGKSTIISLLLRLYDATNQGDGSQLMVAGHDIQKLNVANLRSHVAYVPQQALLFPMSIKDNILYGSEDKQDGCSSADDRLHMSARLAGIHDFITTLPSGYETIVGEGGLSVSGGQAQRIALARGFARKAKILLLDEPTSALDDDSARIIRQSLSSLLEQPPPERPTIIVVTHSKEMMQIAGNIVMLKDGSVAEQGTFQDLMTRQGDFYHLMRAEGE